MVSPTQAAIGGTPTASGTFTGTIAATDSSNPNATGTTSFSIAIAAPTLSLSPPGLPGSTVGYAYSQTFTTSGGTAPYTYAVTGGALPPGMTLASNGYFSGTPTAGGSFTFTLTSTDSSTASSGGPYTASGSYTLNVAAPTITVAPATLPGSTVGVAYSQTLSANGGTAPYSFAITSGALPAGLALSSVGILSGTPRAGGTYTFTVTSTDSSTGTGPYAGSRSYTLSVAAASVVINQTGIASGTVGQAYSQTLTASGGTSPYSYAIIAGVLPPGLTLSTAGVVSGTPTGGGNYTFTVRATDSSGGTGPYSGTRSYTATIAAPAIAIAPATLPDGKKGVAYSQQVSATGGTAPYRYAVVAGALPPDLTLATGGTISGTPRVTGTFNFTVHATDSSGGSGPYGQDQNYSLTIAPSVAITPTTLPNGQVYIAYSQTVTGTGGQAPYSFAVTSGALPDGLSLDTASGTLSGTPTTQGNFAFTITATDASQQSATQSYSISIAAPASGYARTWVSGGGDDAGICSRAAPCASFAAAYARTAPGGEINCVDEGGYGSLTITHSLTIACTGKGARGRVLASGAEGVTVAAGAGDKVVLSGLDLEGVGNSAATPGTSGVRFTGAGSLVIAHASVRGWRGYGIEFVPSGSASLELIDVQIADSGSATAAASAGVLVRATASGSVVKTSISNSSIAGGQGVGLRLDAVGSGSVVQASVQRSAVTDNADAGILARSPGGSVQAIVNAATLAGNGYGIRSNGANTVVVANSVIARNATGLLVNAPGSISSAGNNSLAGNGADGTFSSTTPQQ